MIFCQVTEPKIGHVLLRLRHLDLQSCLLKSAWYKRVAWSIKVSSYFAICGLSGSHVWPVRGKTIHLGD